ncbi:D-amino acid dehydrogenase [Entomobacter blattae]|uniref:D-amino acid dehydrogenase 1 n=1 Tax=Entomobacter blattae TaxID=2762277 RepID=A0A7H1NPY3_9PROT|nr:D-amino acid dehydrogenase [Entomobacter blattae]QNT77843.1 D-amino acid dehydrogenase 1 [Entomobacter blattae]
MKIIILGAGVIGVTSAYYLAKSGHEVIVLDRRDGPAKETSFANAGQVSPGYSTPWASPSLPGKLFEWLKDPKHSPLKITPRLDPAMFKWLLLFAANCNRHHFDVNKGRMLRVAQYSKTCLDELRQETGIQYDNSQKGLIQLFRTSQQLDNAYNDMRLLSLYHIEHSLLDTKSIIEHEPGLANAQSLLKGGLYIPGDESGNAYKFTKKLAQMAEELGVVFQYNTTIEALEATSNSILSIRTSSGRMTADSYILAAGSYSSLLLKPLKLDVPLFPIKGYSLTLPLTNPEAAPVSTVNDETYKVAITRLGNHIRIGGTAELAGYDLSLHHNRRLPLETSFSDLFGPTDFSKATFWTGLRPATPDGTPIIGNSGKFKNLWLNTGHGTLGWTMACGSGRLITDMVNQKKTEIPSQDLSLERYKNAWI